MNKLAWIGILLIALIVGVVGAAAVQNYYYPQTVTVGPKLLIYLEDSEWVNGTTIDWGSVEPDASYLYDLNVQNVSNGTVKVYMNIINLPVAWTEVWSKNETVLLFEEWANGTLTLTVPYDAPLGLYEWDSFIKGEYT